MHRLPLLVAVLLALSWTPALAQVASATARGPIIEVRVEGTATYADIVRTIIAARRGTEAERVDLEAERNRVYALGIFEEVSVALEDRGAGPVLIVRVRENPPISGVEIEGAQLLDPAQMRDVIISDHMLESGRTLSSLRADQAISSLQRIYRSVGLPYDIGVQLDMISDVGAETVGGRTPVRLRYLLDEGAPIRRVAFVASSLLDEEELRQIFRAVEDGDEFNFLAYRQAVANVEARYEQAGLRGSGVDLEGTSLVGGVLTVRFRELRIAAFDTTALGVDASELSLRVGDLYNYDLLLQDVRRLVAGRSSDVRIEPLSTASGAVRVRFAVGAPATAGPITRVEVEGVTHLDAEALAEGFALQVGDTFTSALADEDFRSILDAYNAAGVVIDVQSSYAYQDGLYLQRVREMRIGGYLIVYDGEPGRTQERVITRYLPDEGELVNLTLIDDGLRALAGLGAVVPVNRTLLPGEADDEVIVQLVLRANSTGTLQPGAQYTTESGFSANVAFTETNLWGLAHSFSAEVQAQASDIGLQFGGGLSYSIPWLDIDFLDFREVPTSVSFSVFSRVDVNQRLVSDGSLQVHYPGLPPTDDTLVPIGEYSLRSSGLALSTGRRVLPFTTLTLGLRTTFDQYMLEPARQECEFDDDGAVTNRERCGLPWDDALDYLPDGGLNAFASATLNFDNRDSFAFPREGIAAVGSVGFGWGNDQRDPLTGEADPYTYQQVQLGVKTYFTLADMFPGTIQDRNHVFGVRLHGGHQFGSNYPSSRRFRVGRVPVEATEIRGYRDADFDLSRTYLTSSLEYRYDFGFTSVVTDTIIGIVFLDLAWVSDVPGYAPYDTPIFGAAGLGVQINLGFGGVSLPAVRFDYGFSHRNPTGVFAFRVGPVF